MSTESRAQLYRSTRYPSTPFYHITNNITQSDETLLVMPVERNSLLFVAHPHEYVHPNMYRMLPIIGGSARGHVTFAGFLRVDKTRAPGVLLGLGCSNLGFAVQNSLGEGRQVGQSFPRASLRSQHHRLAFDHLGHRVRLPKYWDNTVNTYCRTTEQGGTRRRVAFESSSYRSCTMLKHAQMVRWIGK